jgi:FkbM family methyltransferase
MFRRLPSKRALAAYVKLRGYRLERRWPFLVRAEGKALNLTFADLLEFQYARSRDFVFLTIGAYDGAANDPISEFAETHRCRGILVEPQPSAFERLRNNLARFPGRRLVNAAVDVETGTRTLYHVPPGNHTLPAWTEQIASFSLEHVTKHEADAPGLSAHVVSRTIETVTFDSLIDRFDLRRIDVLQIDAEGMDGQLLKWFPFHRLRPGVLHYETVHLAPEEHREARRRLRDFGYFVTESDAPTDDMAVLI